MARRIRLALSLLIMAALLCALMFQGRRFLWCPMMLEARATCCCPAAPHDQPGPSIERPGCCDSRSVPVVPHTSASVERGMSLISLAVTTDAIAIVGDSQSHVAESVVALRAWSGGGPPPPARGPPYALNCAYLI